MTNEKLLKKLELYITLHGRRTLPNCYHEKCKYYGKQMQVCLWPHDKPRRAINYNSHDSGKTIGEILHLFEEDHVPEDIYFNSCIEFLDAGDNK